jgi:pentatricopeptide repeat protein
MDDLRSRLAAQEERAKTVDGESKRVQKRVWAAIGKLKKAIAEQEAVAPASAAVPAAAAAEADGVADADGKEGKRQPKEGKAGKKARLHTLNRKISEYAKSKQLGKALSCFNMLKKEGLLKEKGALYSFTNLINVHVRCGDAPAAMALFLDMKQSGVVPSVVTYTSLIKGLSEAGDLAAVSTLVADMQDQNPPIVPNVRTVNTVLRGCVRAGDVECALRLFESMNCKWKLAADATTYECMVSLLCQGLRLDEGLEVMNKLLQTADETQPGSNSLLSASSGSGDSAAAAGGAGTAGGAGGAGGGSSGAHGAGGTNAIENAALYVRLAAAGALLGRWTLCREMLSVSMELLEDNVSLRNKMKQKLLAAMDEEEAAKGSAGGGAGKGGGGKMVLTEGGARAAAEAAAERERRVRSVEKFISHRRGELLLDSEMVMAFLREAEASTFERASSVGAGSGRAGQGKGAAADRLLGGDATLRESGEALDVNALPHVKDSFWLPKPLPPSGRAGSGGSSGGAAAVGESAALAMRPASADPLMPPAPQLLPYLGSVFLFTGAVERADGGHAGGAQDAAGGGSGAAAAAAGGGGGGGAAAAAASTNRYIALRLGGGLPAVGGGRTGSATRGLAGQTPGRVCRGGLPFREGRAFTGIHCAS